MLQRAKSSSFVFCYLCLCLPRAKFATLQSIVDEIFKRHPLFCRRSRQQPLVHDSLSFAWVVVQVARGHVVGSSYNVFVVVPPGTSLLLGNTERNETPSASTAGRIHVNLVSDGGDLLQQARSFVRGAGASPCCYCVCVLLTQPRTRRNSPERRSGDSRGGLSFYL